MAPALRMTRSIKEKLPFFCWINGLEFEHGCGRRRESLDFWPLFVLSQYSKHEYLVLEQVNTLHAFFCTVLLYFILRQLFYTLFCAIFSPLPFCTSSFRPFLLPFPVRCIFSSSSLSFLSTSIFG
jgi:hypothetical protein